MGKTGSIRRSMLLILGVCTFLLGAVCSCYFQLYCSLGRVYYYWKLLVKYAYQEREFFLIIFSHKLVSQDVIIQQQNTLKEMMTVDRKSFRCSGEKLMLRLISMEEEFNLLTMTFLQEETWNSDKQEPLGNKEPLVVAFEKFWAAKNLFEFQSHNYNHIVSRYFITHRKFFCCWLSTLLSYPRFPEAIPSFY